MAKRSVLVKRRKAVHNIRKITRTMQLIATARFQTAFNRAVAARPLHREAGRARRRPRARRRGHRPPAAGEPEPGGAARRSLVLTSNRGLCGGYNANVLRLAHERLAGRREAGRGRELHAFGKKGIALLQVHQGSRWPTQNAALDDMPRYEQVEPIASELIDAFLAGRVSEVERRLHAVRLGEPPAPGDRPAAAARRRHRGAGARERRRGADPDQAVDRVRVPPRPGHACSPSCCRRPSASVSSRPSSTPRSPSRSRAWWP